LESETAVPDEVASIVDEEACQLQCKYQILLQLLYVAAGMSTRPF